MAATLSPPPAPLVPDGSADAVVDRVGDDRDDRPHPGTRPEGPRTGTLLASALIGVLVLVLGFLAFLVGGSRLAADRYQALAYDDLVAALKRTEVPVNGAQPIGTPLGLLQIPQLGLTQVFVQGSSSEQTALAPGLRPDTSLPGQAGGSVLVGRRATFGAPFAHLDRLRPGDRFTVTTGQGRFTYVVDLVRTSDAAPTTVPVVASRLTLVTSDPALAPSRTLTVSARLQGEALPRTTGAAAGVAARPTDAVGEGSSDHLVSLVLWSQLLLLVALGLTWAWVRVPQAATLRRSLWIGGVPVLLALLWTVFGQLALLLPNTL
ncbi:sortase [Nocardioides sp. TRM66260-LWL]|uniref:sortase domain-containing protein n=1 Tax=Nocardioides sp. TRM66260-LWL TaxID=2874478 RepID=UPI001CC3F36C|nr:sortase [Nocardioides sp. TRM66260-LWL]MBZ5734395.1 sortase [Nocardioides sp. TRM66260-LWL]